MASSEMTRETMSFVTLLHSEPVITLGDAFLRNPTEKGGVLGFGTVGGSHVASSSVSCSALMCSVQGIREGVVLFRTVPCSNFLEEVRTSLV